MGKNEAHDIQMESLEQQIKSKKKIGVNDHLVSLFVDRDSIQDLYHNHPNDRKFIAQTLWGYFEHPEKGELYKRVKFLLKSEEKPYEEKKLIASLFSSKLTLREMFSCPSLFTSQMDGYKALWSIVLPLLQERISQEILSQNIDKASAQSFKTITNKAPLNKSKNFNDLKLNLECLANAFVGDIDLDKILDTVELPFNRVITELANGKRKTRGILAQMEPLFAAHIETKVVDKINAFGKQVEAYEQWVYRGDVTKLVGVIHNWLLDDQLRWLDRSEFVNFLVSLYTSKKSIVEVPWPWGSKLQLAIAERSLWSAAIERLMKEQPKGDWDETIPVAYIDIDIHKSSPEIAVLIASYFPEKYETNNGTEKEWIVTLENRELIELEDVYLTCAHYELNERTTIKDKNISKETNDLFEDIKNRQQWSGDFQEDNFTEDAQVDKEGNEEEMTGGSATSDDEESEEEKERKKKGASYAFGGYTDKIPPKLEAELRKEMGKNYPKHGPYAWIEKGKVYYNTKWIAEKFGIAITLNPNPLTNKKGEVILIDKYLFNGKSMNDPELDTWTPEFRAFSAWKEEQKRHEVLHRILWFNKIDQITVKTVDGEETVLIQEQICQLAEAVPGTRGEQVTVNGKSYLLTDIENAIAKALGRDSFSFETIHQIDLDALEDYIEHGDEVFLDQLDANAGARTFAKWEVPDGPALQAILTAHETTAPRKPNKGGGTRSSAVNIGPNKYVNFQNGWASVWKQIIPDPDEKNNPFQQPVTAADMEAELTKLNNGDYDGVLNPEPNTAPANTRGHGGRNADPNQPEPQTASREHEEENDFKGQFETTIDGDMNTKFKVWTLLYLKMKESTIPGYGNIWVQTEIVDINEETKKYQVKVTSSTEWNLEGGNGKVYTLEMTEKWLSNLRQRGEIRKYTKVSNGKDFYEYISQKLDTDDRTIKSWKEPWAGQQIKREDGKLLQKKYYNASAPKYDVVTHIGKIDKNNMKNTVLYGVIWNSNTVTVTLENPSWTREMDYNTFLVFCVEKWLAPFSDEQIKKAKEAKETYKDSQRPGVSWMTLGTIIQAAKNIWPLVKNYFNFEERKKIQAARLTYSVAKAFGGGFALEALTSLDEAIFSTISKFQSSLGGRDSKDANDIQAEAVSRRIQKEIFTPGITLDPGMFKLKAAGYLLYALDKGWHPYFRALNGNAHQWLWVKAILWDKHHGVFLRERQKLIDEAKSGPENQILFDKLVKFELTYIQNATETEDMVEVFWSQFSKKVEGYKDKFGAGDAIDNIKNSMANKNNFDDYAATFRWTLVKHTPATSLAALELMVESAWTQAQYSEVYQSIVQLYVSWLGTWTFGQEHKDRLKKIWRMAGVPIALMADDINAPHKVLTMIDYIAERAGIPKLSSKSWLKDTISVENLTNNSGHKKAMDGVMEWWNTNRNWQTVINAFNYKNNHLLSYEETAKGQTKDIIDEYFGKRVFDELADTRFGHSEKLTLGWDSPFYSNGILNISPATFDKVMLRIDRNWQFNEPWAPAMRAEFRSIMGQMDQSLTNSSGASKKFLLKLIVKKFALYMWSKFESKELADFKKSLVDGIDIDKIGDLLKFKFSGGLYVAEEADFDIKKNERTLVKKKKRGKWGNSQINDGLDSLITLLSHHAKDIDSETIRFAFGR